MIGSSILGASNFLIFDSMYYVALNVLINILESLSTIDPNNNVIDEENFFNNSKNKKSIT